MALGGLTLLYCGYGLLAFSMQSKEYITEKYAKTGIDANQYYKEGLDAHRRNGTIVTAIMTLAGAGIMFGGYKLYRKKIINLQN